MQLHDVISLSGRSGLFTVAGNTKGGIIAESITDGKRFPVTDVRERITNISYTSIRTVIPNPDFKEGGKNPFIAGPKVMLQQIFERINAHESSPPDANADSTVLIEYFKAIVPDFDKEHLFASNIKTILTWFSLLRNKIDFSVSKAKVRVSREF